MICPECGESKEVMTLISGNTFNADFWSDGKMYAHYLPQTSPIQRCPHCGDYFWMPDQEMRTAQDFHTSFELGRLTYAETKEGVKKLLGTEPEAQKELAIRIAFIQAYNDEFVRLDKIRKRLRVKTSVPTEEDRNFFNECQESVYGLFIAQDKRSSAAESLRELGRLDECIAMIESMERIDPNDELDYDTQILRHAKKGISAVFYRRI